MKKIALALAGAIAAITLTFAGAAPANALSGTNTITRTCAVGVAPAIAAQNYYSSTPLTIKSYSAVTGAFLGQYTVGGGGSIPYIKFSNTISSQRFVLSGGSGYAAQTRC